MKRRNFLFAGLSVLGGSLIPSKARSAIVGHPGASDSGIVRPRSPWDRLLDAISWVESRGDPKAVGDGGRAIGLYQIWKCYVDDCNRIMGQRVWSYRDRWDPVQSRKMVHCYLVHYGRAYERKTGLPASARVLASLHCSGPDGWKQLNEHRTALYCKKVLAAMKS